MSQEQSVWRHTLTHSHTHTHIHTHTHTHTKPKPQKERVPGHPVTAVTMPLFFSVLYLSFSFSHRSERMISIATNIYIYFFVFLFLYLSRSLSFSLSLFHPLSPSLPPSFSLFLSPSLIHIHLSPSVGPLYRGLIILIWKNPGCRLVALSPTSLGTGVLPPG